MVPAPVRLPDSRVQVLVIHPKKEQKAVWQKNFLNS